MKKMKRDIVLFFLPCLAYHLYFVLLLESVSVWDLMYLDVLLLVCFGIYLRIRIYRFRERERKKNDYMESEGTIAEELSDYENIEIAFHDQRILTRQLEEQRECMCDLQDYITKWCHEVKIPLSAALLVNERIEDAKERQRIKEPLEKIRRLLNDALAGCKIQSQMFDLQIRPVNLKECVRESIRNQQFFLIQKHFTLDIRVENVIVYSDSEWLIYVIDQFIGNAVKYAKEEPKLMIWAEEEPEKIRMMIEDRGEGILPEDMRRIYDKGFTGSNHRDGQYKSTGMGLYMVSQILHKLEHQIEAESEYGVYTRFTITFTDHRKFFHL